MESEGVTPSHWADIRRRLDGQAADHWTEFAVVVASGSIGLALLAGGLVVTSTQHVGTKLLLGAMVVASLEAIALSYYGIMVGVLGSVGPLREVDIIASFGIAASQLAMPSWVAHVARAERYHTASDLVVGSRHWILFAGLFGLSAALANAAAARRRHKTPGPVPVWLKRYDNRQWFDFKCSGGMGLSASLTYLTVLWLAVDRPHDALAVTSAGVGGLIVAFFAGFCSQGLTIRRLLADTGDAPTAPPGHEESEEVDLRATSVTSSDLPDPG